MTTQLSFDYHFPHKAHVLSLPSQSPPPKRPWVEKKVTPKWLALVNGNMDQTCGPIPGGLILTHTHFCWGTPQRTRFIPAPVPEPSPNFFWGHVHARSSPRVSRMSRVRRAAAGTGRRARSGDHIPSLGSPKRVSSFLELVPPVFFVVYKGKPKGKPREFSLFFRQNLFLELVPPVFFVVYKGKPKGTPRDFSIFFRQNLFLELVPPVFFVVYKGKPKGKPRDFSFFLAKLVFGVGTPRVFCGL